MEGVCQVGNGWRQMKQRKSGRERGSREPVTEEVLIETARERYSGNMELNKKKFWMMMREWQTVLRERRKRGPGCSVSHHCERETTRG